MIVVLALLLGAGLGALGYTTAYRHREDGQPKPLPVITPAALASAAATPSGLPASTAAAPAPAAVTAALAKALADPRLGGRVLATVQDAASGAVLLDQNGSTPGIPASTAKLSTAAALLAHRAATDRITTRVVAGATPGTVVLVGAGDPTLSAAAPGQPTPYPDAARLSDLAAAVRKAGVSVSQVVVDDSYFAGPTVSPAWDPQDVPTEYGAAITAVMADGGRASPLATVRSATPDLDAGQEFAALLGVPGAVVTRGTAPAGAPQLAGVQSAPLGELVRQMLQLSDDVVAECLARQVVDTGPRSFATATAAVRAQLAAIGVDIGSGLVDGSGLARADRIAPAATAAVLRAVVRDAPLRPIVDGLPVAGWDGTLAGRYATGSAHGAAGDVRAKTGTLTGVSALAGFVTDASGRLLIFAVEADQVGPSYADTLAAEAALDDVAAALAGVS